MNRRRLWRGIALAMLASAPLGAFLWSPDAEATTFAPLSLEQMTDASTAVVRATVKEVWTEVDAYERVWTKARIQVTETWKGADVPSELVVESQGGRFGSSELRINGRARFSPNEDNVLFLYLAPSGQWTTVQMALGKFIVQRAPEDTRPYLRNWHASEGSPVEYDGRFLPHLPLESRQYLDEFQARVQARVQAGWDGQPIPGLTLQQLSEINLAEKRIPR